MKQWGGEGNLNWRGDHLSNSLRCAASTYSFIVLLGLQSLSDVCDGFYSGLQLLRQREVRARAINELPHVCAQAFRVKPAEKHGP